MSQPAASSGGYFLDACQLQSALPVEEPLILPPANRPRQYCVVTGFVRVKLMLLPLTRPPEIVPMSCHEVPAKLPLKLPPEVSESSNSPCQRPMEQS